jgi:hypothetical protein
MSFKTKFQIFENGLNPAAPQASSIPVNIIGYGEISAVLQLESEKDVVAKRMPLFTDDKAAEIYAYNHHNYCRRLRKAGINVPLDDTTIVNGHGNLIVLYILQKHLPPERFCHKLIHTESPAFIEEMGKAIIADIEKVWVYNEEHKPETKLAIDGQLSNWVLLESGELFFVDTSTPLMHELALETLNPELLIQSAPSLLKWLIRWQFLDDVMTRYYDRRLVYTDLIANLFKEQRADLVEPWLALINAETSELMKPLEKKQIHSYYKEDKLIWRLFLFLRRMDRFFKTKLLRQRYDFILPGKIKR